MVEKVKLPDFIKDGAKAAMEPLNKLEERISNTLKKISKDKTVPSTEMKKVLDDSLKWVKTTRADVEKSFNETVTKALSLLNLPSKSDLTALEKKVKKLTKSVKDIEKAVAPKKPAKKKAKKPAVKKAVKKTAKKATKKAAK